MNAQHIVEPLSQSALSVYADPAGSHPRSERRDALEIRFGRCCAMPGARRLLVDGKSVEIGSRAFDLRLVLLHARGTVISKETIVMGVWPSITVDESNVRFQVAVLRKALGADRNLVKTIPGRGYMLVVDCDTTPKERAESPEAIHPLDPITRRAEHRNAPSIIVVEEDTRQRERVRRILQATGLSVQVYCSVEDLLLSSHASQHRVRVKGTS